MALSNSTVMPQLSIRQRRMLQDMGIDVFTARRSAIAEPSDIQPLTEATAPPPISQPSAAPSPIAGPSSAPTPVESPTPVSGSSTAPVNDGRDSLVDTHLRIELNVVATSALIHLSENPLSAQELRFLQDLAGDLHWAHTRSALDEKARNSEFRWPIVEATGTPERAIAVFCQKHQMLSGEIAVLITPGAQAILTPWIKDEASHWIAVETLSGASSNGDAKRALWLQAMQSLPAAKSS